MHKFTDMYMQPPVGDLEALQMYNDHGSVVSHERPEVRFGRKIWIQLGYKGAVGKNRPAL